MADNVGLEPTVSVAQLAYQKMYMPLGLVIERLYTKSRPDVRTERSVSDSLGAKRSVGLRPGLDLGETKVRTLEWTRAQESRVSS